MISTTLRHNKDTQRIRYRLYGLAAGLVIWQLLAVLISRPLILPRLEAVAVSIFHIITGKKFILTVGTTLFRIAATIILDTAAAFLFGIAAGLSGRLESAFAPIETGMRAMPTMGLLLLSLIWFNSEITPVFVASLIAFPLLYRGVVNGVKNIDSRLMQMSAGFRVPFARRLLKLYIPAIKPFTLTAYSTALGLLVKVMVTAEVLSQPKHGIGTEFQIARAQLDTAAIFGWSIIVIVIAAAVEYGAKKLLAFGTRTPLPESQTEAQETPQQLSCSACSTGVTAPSYPVRETEIRIDGISFAFSGIPIFESYSMTLKPAQIQCLLGRSGSGKTTLLFLIAGFLRPQTGRILISPPDAKIGFAYQDIRLIPHLTAAENIRYVLPRVYTKQEAEQTAQYYLQLFGLAGFEHFLPHELSGGMQRRVGLARALAYPCEILLLDEAFDSLDPQTKKAAVSVFSRRAATQRQTVLCVTHDPALPGLLNSGTTLTAESTYPSARMNPCR